MHELKYYGTLLRRICVHLQSLYMYMYVVCTLTCCDWNAQTDYLLFDETNEPGLGVNLM